jgi:hypothetical protein
MATRSPADKATDELFSGWQFVPTIGIEAQPQLTASSSNGANRPQLLVVARGHLVTTAIEPVLIALPCNADCLDKK